MRKDVILFVIVFIILGVVLFSFFQLSGKVIDESGKGSIGPSAEEQKCMEDCVAIGCEEGDSECMTANSEKCGQQCGVSTISPKPANEKEECMQECVVRDCGEYEFDCQNSKRNDCEDECGMKGDAPDESEMSEEQLCISECVAKVDPSIICGSGSYEGVGEQGNEVCQRCAAECVHLYAGPCSTDELWREKEEECMAEGEHMEAVPVKGDSGEGYECTIDIECVDRSDEWGDEPGTGPGIGQEGYVAPNVVAGAVDGIIKFFKGLFSGGEEEIIEE